MFRFGDLKFHPHSYPGARGDAAKIFFDNGYGASVVRFATNLGVSSYGFEDGLYELGIMAGTADDWRLTYATPITDDVIGWLTEAQVTRLLNEIAALPRNENARAEAKLKTDSFLHYE